MQCVSLERFHHRSRRLPFSTRHCHARIHATLPHFLGHQARQLHSTTRYLLLICFPHSDRARMSMWPHSWDEMSLRILDVRQTGLQVPGLVAEEPWCCNAAPQRPCVFVQVTAPIVAEAQREHGESFCWVCRRTATYLSHHARSRIQTPAT